MVKQYANGYFEKGAWKRGNYEATQKFLDIVDVDLRPINANSVLKVNGSEGGWEFAELTNTQSRCDDCPCTTPHTESSYGSLLIIGITLAILTFFILIFICNI